MISLFENICWRFFYIVLKSLLESLNLLDNKLLSSFFFLLRQSFKVNKCEEVSWLRNVTHAHPIRKLTEFNCVSSFIVRSLLLLMHHHKQKSSERKVQFHNAFSLPMMRFTQTKLQMFHPWAASSLLQIHFSSCDYFNVVRIFSSLISCFHRRIKCVFHQSSLSFNVAS